MAEAMLKVETSEPEGPVTPAMLIAWRQRMGFSQRDAADALGCSRGGFAGWESGKNSVPRYIGLAMAALAMGMKPYFEVTEERAS